MNIQYLYYAGAVAAAGFIARNWVKFRYDRRARKGYETPLFEDEKLTLTFMPIARDGDDANVLAEMRQTLAHLNRQTYAEEFWNLDQQLTVYYGKLPESKRPTMRRALIRMVIANERWLQVVGAKTCASLSLPEAVPPLQALLEIGDSLRPGDPEVDYGRGSKASDRFFRELEAALQKLQPTSNASGN